MIEADVIRKLYLILILTLNFDHCPGFSILPSRVMCYRHFEFDGHLVQAACKWAWGRGWVSELCGWITVTIICKAKNGAKCFRPLTLFAGKFQSPSRG